MRNWIAILLFIHVAELLSTPVPLCDVKHHAINENQTIKYRKKRES
jgi:hypothetical protein